MGACFCVYRRSPPLRPEIHQYDIVAADQRPKIMQGPMVVGGSTGRGPGVRGHRGASGVRIRRSAAAAAAVVRGRRCALAAAAAVPSGAASGRVVDSGTAGSTSVQMATGIGRRGRKGGCLGARLTTYCRPTAATAVGGSTIRLPHLRLGAVIAPAGGNGAVAAVVERNGFSAHGLGLPGAGIAALAVVVAAAGTATAAAATGDVVAVVMNPPAIAARTTASRSHGSCIAGEVGAAGVNTHHLAAQATTRGSVVAAVAAVVAPDARAPATAPSGAAGSTSAGPAPPGACLRGCGRAWRRYRG